MIENLKKKEDKIIICDFDLLKEDDFPFTDFSKRELKDYNNIISIDGTVYINKDCKGLTEVAVPIFKMLTNQSGKALKRFKVVNFRKYWKYNLDNFTDFVEEKLKEKSGEAEAIECITYLLIPMELERRRIERWYIKNKK